VGRDLTKKKDPPEKIPWLRLGSCEETCRPKKIERYNCEKKKGPEVVVGEKGKAKQAMKLCRWPPVRGGRKKKIAREL